MKTGARVAAAIEILDLLAESDLPAEQVLKTWGRQNRYAGSKDRAQIGEYVFAVCRHRGTYAFQMSSDDSRSLMIAHLAELDPAMEWTPWFGDTEHAPKPLSETETKSAKEVASKDAPLSARVSVPAWLEPDLIATFGQDIEPELKALLARAPIDLRVNALKTARKPARVHLAKEGIETTPSDIARKGLRVSAAGDIRPTQIQATKAFQSGEVEIQDMGSQWIVENSSAQPGQKVFDLCAGGGGKTLALAARMRNQGKLRACDVNPRRLANIKPRLKRSGAEIVTLQKMSVWAPDQKDHPDPELESWKGEGHLVFCDVPCSGSGAWRRHPAAKWRLTPEILQSYHQSQQDVLNRAARLVRPGGELVYVTCSILHSENAAQVEQFLQNHPDFTSREVEADIAVRPLGPGYQLSPHRTDTDGFFVSYLTKNA
jgi:16S rRNA (cytosine967-C5)-methyltransferase